MMPVTKIVWGIVLGVLGLVTIATPLGIILLVAAVILVAVGMTQRGKPNWQVRALVRRASKHPQEASALLDQALQLAPDNPEALAANADRRFREGSWALAADLYERYLRHAPQDWLAEGHAASAWLNAGKPQAAIPHFLNAREHPGLTDDTRASVTALLAMAYLSEGDAHRAIDVAASEPLQRHNLGEGMQRCLFLRGLAHYQAGQHSRGISDLDRLAAMNPDFPSLQEVRNEMLTGTFSLDPKAAPAAASTSAP
jgi:tetratricopeptide (TPR) repeat protein